LYCSSEIVGNGVCLLKNKTSGVSVSETKITASSTGIYLFNPLQTSVSSGLPSSFVSGWVSEKNLIVAPLNATVIKADIQTDKQFNGILMFRLSVGDFGLIKFKTAWQNLTSQTFLSAKNQLKQDIPFVSPIKISKNDRIFLEFGVRITSVSPSTTIILNVNTMETTAILLPTFAINKCFYIGASNQVNLITSPNAATTPLLSINYYLINASDNVYSGTGASATTLHRYGNVAHRFTFNCSGYTSVTNISIIWEGYNYGTVADLKKVQIYNSSGLWENWQDSIPTTDTSYSKSLGTGTNYFYNSTWIMFGDYAYQQKEADNTVNYQIRIDYASVTITYGVSKSWRDVSSWAFTLLTRIWKPVTIWALTLNTMKWNSVSTWVFNLLTRSWNPVSTWIFSLNTMQWKTVSTFIFYLNALGWHNVTLWLFVLAPPTNITIYFVVLLLVAGVLIFIYVLSDKD
jgi:hypothetical protein